MNLLKCEFVKTAGIRFLRILASLLFIAAVTWMAFSVLKTSALIVGFMYVLAVLVVAAHWGLAESLSTAISATLCFNYFFFPPVLSFAVANPQNWVALFVFMVTALTASKLSTNAQRGAAEAQDRRIEVEHLYQLSFSLMLIDTAKELGPQIADSIIKQFNCIEVAFCDGPTEKISVAGIKDPRLDSEMLRTVALGKDAWFVSRKRLSPTPVEMFMVPVALGGKILGSLAAIGPSLSEPAVQAIANSAAIAIERARQQITLGRVEAARQNERLRGLLLDALAHDFLTPLTSIKSAITTVRSEYPHEAEEDDFLAVVEEEADRLSEMINETTDLARIEPGKPHLRRRPVSIMDFVQPSLARMKTTLEGHPLQMQIQEDLPPVHADPHMMGLVLRQLLNNAVKYSPPETTIAIAANQSGDTVTLRVRDQGPGISADELELIFERFYRGKRIQDSVAGTGMGLSIARDVIRAHHGRLWVENAPEGGAVFSFTLPVFREDKKL